MGRKIEIDEETCTKIERTQYEYMSLVNVEKSYLDDHMLDADAAAIESPIFTAYHKMTTDAFIAYENAKTEMVVKYGIETQNWQLDFASREVTIG